MKKALNHLSADFIRSIMIYDPETGVAHWRHRKGVSSNWNTKWAGRRINSSKTSRYVKMRIDGTTYFLHRVIWVYMTGEWPALYVDHEDTDKRNNRWCNLRQCDPSGSGANRRIFKNNKIGLKGVHWYTSRNCYRAVITPKGKYIMLGLFDCPAAAHLAYVIAADKEFNQFARSA